MIPNLEGELCAHYPLGIIVFEAERTEGVLVAEEAANRASELQRLFIDSRFARKARTVPARAQGASVA